jgi:transposase-like protein
MNCPNCGERSLQHKIGFTKAKSQRYKCQHCEKRYTPEPKSRGYSESLRNKAIQLYVDGLNFRRIGRILSVHHQSVINWVNAYAEELPEASVPDETEST